MDKYLLSLPGAKRRRRKAVWPESASAGTCRLRVPAVQTVGPAGRGCATSRDVFARRLARVRNGGVGDDDGPETEVSEWARSGRRLAACATRLLSTIAGRDALRLVTAGRGRTA